MQRECIHLSEIAYQGNLVVLFSGRPIRAILRHNLQEGPPSWQPGNEKNTHMTVDDLPGREF